VIVTGHADGPFWAQQAWYAANGEAQFASTAARLAVEFVLLSGPQICWARAQVPAASNWAPQGPLAPV
jgi:hypothetical protein